MPGFTTLVLRNAISPEVQSCDMLPEYECAAGQESSMAQMSMAHSNREATHLLPAHSAQDRYSTFSPDIEKGIMEGAEATADNTHLDPVHRCMTIYMNAFQMVAALCMILFTVYVIVVLAFTIPNASERFRWPYFDDISTRFLILGGLVCTTCMVACWCNYMDDTRPVTFRSAVWTAWYNTEIALLGPASLVFAFESWYEIVDAITKSLTSRG